MSASRSFARSFLLAVLLAASGFAIGQTLPPGREVPLAQLDDAALLEALWRERAADLSVFDDAFLEAVPEDRLRTILRGAIDEFGEVQTVTKQVEENRYTLATATHDVPMDLVRGADGRISGLLLRVPVARDTTLERVLQALPADGTDAAWLLLENGERVDGHEADEPLAVGSAFKLWVLDAYRRAVERGDVGRTDVVRLEARHRSWPSGILQEAPVGMPVTLETLATLMISMSDNTATDVLVDVLGRDEIEALSPFEPLLTTAELFKLKLDPELEARYSAADSAERRTLLELIAERELPAVTRMPPAPLPGVEWYASAQALCRVIERVAQEPATSVPTGLVDRTGWAKVTDKGGSERGVLSVAARLVGLDGTTWCFAVTWNGRPGSDGRPASLDEVALLSKVASVVARLK